MLAMVERGKKASDLHEKSSGLGGSVRISSEEYLEHTHRLADINAVGAHSF